MAKRRNDTLKRRVGSREYRDVCWVSPEGRTEADYLVMDAFKDSSVTVRFPENIHPSRRDPKQVLKRFQKAMRDHDFRKGDEAWILVDIALDDDVVAPPRSREPVEQPLVEVVLQHQLRGYAGRLRAVVDECLQLHRVSRSHSSTST